MNDNLKLSYQGAAFIAQFEGFSPTWYICPAGKETIGFGHVRTKSDDYGSVGSFDIPLERCDAIAVLSNDAELAADTVRRKVKIHLFQYEFDALVSFVYNVGVNAFSKSTLLKLINYDAKPAAAEQFKRWTKAGGKELSGLVKRREAERKLFVSGDYE